HTLRKEPISFYPHKFSKNHFNVVEVKALRDLFTSSAVVESREEVKIKGEAEAIEAWIDFDKMIEVPSGPFLYGEDQHEEKIEQPFLIDVYPVTNQQFRRFIEGGGYTHEEFWSEEGIKWKGKWKGDNRIIYPQYWNDEKWNKPDHPVVGVSWYEANAYAKWANKRTPTEMEWEKSARGEDGRVYPWGNDFDKEKCNTYESGIGSTNRVARYPAGISTIGCYDMAGNVWEWTDSGYNKDQDTRVLRGGALDSNQSYARCAFRFFDNPNLRYYNIGFRCVRTLK
ncbi:MAG: SUMF1/EgtB/PvdO family nonheme iron enzyme, partial [Nitrospirota bacterium]